MARQVVTATKIRGSSGTQAYERGRFYFDRGRVEDLSVTETTATARVAGSGSYEVELHLTDSGVTGRCTCPQGAGDRFCKHCVATALAWLAEAGPLALPRPPEKVSDARLRAFLTDQDRAWLVEELMHAAGGSPILRARLEVAAGADVHDVLRDDGLRHRLGHAIKVACTPSYDDVDERIAKADAVLGEVADLADGGFASVAVELAEYALDLLALRDGESDFLTDRVDGLSYSAWRIHRAACADGHPDPVALADRLVDRTLARGELHDALPHYVQALGAAGMSRYRDRLDQAWRELEPAGPEGDADGSAAMKAIRRMRERLAEHEGGADTLIALATPGEAPKRDVLRIVRALIAEERDSDAVDWVRSAVERFGHDAELCELGAGCLARAGDRRGAVALMWPAFIGGPSLHRYQTLAESAGDHWPHWRQRALTLLRDHANTPGREEEFGTLAKILLWEGDIEGAWQVVRDHAVPVDLLLDMARKRAATHPADVIPVLLELADQQIAERNNDAYAQAADILAEAGLLAERSGERDAFERHLAALRASHQVKALQGRLDKAGLP